MIKAFKNKTTKEILAFSLLPFATQYFAAIWTAEHGKTIPMCSFYEIRT